MEEFENTFWQELTFNQKLFIFLAVIGIIFWIYRSVFKHIDDESIASRIDVDTSDFFDGD